ncbi:MAG: aldo/keto reductase [Myxococcales bacterium]|nr:aldo/keto reductase [Myxococcales bacterium]
MRARPFGPLGPVPVVGIGTWNMERDDRRSAVAAIRAALDVGATHVDTAELYGDGRVEEIVAEAIEGRRDEVFLVSKVLPQNASREGAVRACERSLRRLRTDRLDVYLLHWPGPHPLEETIEAFEALVRAGKIRAWGVSNFDVEDLERALAIAGPGRIACNQVLYHLRERGIEHRVVPWCEAHGVAVTGYTPFGRGPFPESHPVLGALARKHGVEPRTIALAFLVRRPSLFAIPKTSTPDRARRNAAAADLTLDADDLEALERAFPLGPPPRTLPTL